jgi:hypothetical protein
MAPETAPHGADSGIQPRHHRRSGSSLLVSAALVIAATVGSLWVTGDVGHRAAAAAIGTAGTVVTPARLPGLASAATSGPRNLLLSADGSLDTPVTVYDDCSGQSELTHDAAAIDTCVGGRTYFVGHNAGVFTPLLSLHAGDVITWYDGAGAAHRLRIVAVRDNWLRDDGVPPLTTSAVVAQFQTCESAYPDGSHDRVLDAVPA